MSISHPLNQRFVQEVGTSAEIAALAEPVLEDLGFRLVRVKVSGGESLTVQVMADRDGEMMTIEDCTTISRNLSPLLDAHDLMKGAYAFEVSSPGIDRPLVRPSDFLNWIGFEAKVELKEFIEDRKRFRGVIEGFEDEEVRLEIRLEGYDEPQLIGLPVDLIDHAKLVMTDHLANAAQTPEKTDKKIT